MEENKGKEKMVLMAMIAVVAITAIAVILITVGKTNTTGQAASVLTKTAATPSSTQPTNLNQPYPSDPSSPQWSLELANSGYNRPFDVEGNIAVYSSQGKLYLYYLNTKTKQVINNNSYYDYAAKISDNNVVYIRQETVFNIFQYNILTGQTTKIVSNINNGDPTFGSAMTDVYLDFDGAIVTYTGKKNGMVGVYYYDITNPSAPPVQVTANGFNTAIKNNKILYYDRVTQLSPPSYHYEVRMYTIPTGANATIFTYPLNVNITDPWICSAYHPLQITTTYAYFPNCNYTRLIYNLNTATLQEIESYNAFGSRVKLENNKMLARITTPDWRLDTIGIVNLDTRKHNPILPYGSSCYIEDWAFSGSNVLAQMSCNNMVEGLWVARYICADGTQSCIAQELIGTPSS